MAESQVTVEPAISLALFGARDMHLRQIRDVLKVDIRTHGDHLLIRGDQDAVTRAATILEKMKTVVERQGSVEPLQVLQFLRSPANSALPQQMPTINVFNTKRQIRAMTAGQAEMIEAIRKHDVTFCVGPAGTGKTYLAVAMAVQALKEERVRKLVLVRPAVEAGEKLGFLPGDLQAKINPFLRPLLDGLAEMMDFEHIKRLIEQDLIEMIPLAYMRGRTLNEAFIILDEAQNTTIPQMKMFLTRLGMGSRMVVSGDATQVDLPPHTPSGLLDAMRRLQRIPQIGQVFMTKTDVVRHSLVQAIVEAYEAADREAL